MSTALQQGFVPGGGMPTLFHVLENCIDGIVSTMRSSVLEIQSDLSANTHNA